MLLVPKHHVRIIADLVDLSFSQMLPRHTWQACQTKYRVVKNKDGNSDSRSPTDASVVREQGRGDAAQVVGKGTDTGNGAGNKDKRAGANTQGPNPTSEDIHDDGQQDSKKTSPAGTVGTSGAPEMDENGGEEPAQDPRSPDWE